MSSDWDDQEYLHRLEAAGFSRDEARDLIEHFVETKGPLPAGPEKPRRSDHRHRTGYHMTYTVRSKYYEDFQRVKDLQPGESLVFINTVTYLRNLQKEFSNMARILNWDVAAGQSYATTLVHDENDPHEGYIYLTRVR